LIFRSGVTNSGSFWQLYFCISKLYRPSGTIQNQILRDLAYFESYRAAEEESTRSYDTHKT